MLKRDIILFISIFSVRLLIGGGTYAYWQWASGDQKIIGFNTASEFAAYIDYNSGNSQFVGDLKPSSSYTGGIYNTISVRKKNVDDADKQSNFQYADVSLIDFVGTIKMDINYIDSEISNSSSVKWLVLEGTTASSTVLASGTFNGKTNGTTLDLVSNLTITTTAQPYTIYIWIDSSTSGNTLTGKSLDTNIWMQIDQIGENNGYE